MRFKKLPLFVLLTTAVYILHLGVTRNLDLYIHPRYDLLTLGMVTIGLVMLLIHALTRGIHGHHHKEKLWSYVPLVIVLGGALLLPARPLTSATVSQRSVDSVSATTRSSKPLHTLFYGSSKGLKLADWVRLLEANTDEAYYVNKTAVVSGFIYGAELGADTVWLARFIVTCCAVDAQPVGIPVQIKDWRAHYKQDQWAEVEGKFKQAETAKGPQLVLIPKSVKSISQPDNPYAN